MLIWHTHCYWWSHISTLSGLSQARILKWVAVSFLDSLFIQRSLFLLLFLNFTFFMWSLFFYQIICILLFQFNLIFYFIFGHTGCGILVWKGRCWRGRCEGSSGVLEETVGTPNCPSLGVFTYLFLASPVALGILVPWPVIKPASPELKARNLNHWTAGKS